MNGKELMESMGYVDEQYIAEAEKNPARRRLHWQPLIAAAACVTLVLTVGWRFLPQLRKTEEPAVNAALYQGEAPAAGTARSVEETAADQAVGAAPMMVSALAEMTVQVVEQRPDALVCLVIDPGTSDFQSNDQVRITLPETTGTTQSQEETAAAALEKAVATQADEGEAPEQRYRVTFLPDQDAATITPVQWTPVPEE